MRTRFHIPFAWRLAVTLSAVILASMSLLATTVIDQQQQLIERQFRTTGMTTVRQLADSAVEPLFTDDLLGLERLVTKLIQLPGIVGTAVLDQDGTPRVAVGLAAPPAVFRAYGADPDTGPAHVQPWPERSSHAPRRVSFLFPVRFDDVTGGHAVVTFSRSDIYLAKAQALWSLIGLALLFSVLVIAAIAWLSRHFGRPIGALVRATEAIAQENYGYRIRGRHRGEFGTLVESFNRMAAGLQEKLQVESVFSRFVSGRVANSLFGDLDQVRLGGKRVSASILFVDIVGFTSLSEENTPEQVAELLNEYFGYFSLAANHFNGIVDKFIGDAGMLVFGVPQPDADHEVHAIAAALLIRDVLERVNARRQERGERPVLVRIGISSGSVLAGIIGSEERMQYTVLGDAVNLASRLCDLGFPGQIVADREFWLRARLRAPVEADAFRTVAVKGKQEPVDTVSITSLGGGRADDIRDTADRMANLS